MEKDFENLLNEIKKDNAPFDEYLPILQDKLWTLASKYNTTGPDIFGKFMDWASQNNKSFK